MMTSAGKKRKRMLGCPKLETRSRRMEASPIKIPITPRRRLELQSPTPRRAIDPIFLDCDLRPNSTPLWPSTRPPPPPNRRSHRGGRTTKKTFPSPPNSIPPSSPQTPLFARRDPSTIPIIDVTLPTRSPPSLGHNRNTQLDKRSDHTLPSLGRLPSITRSCSLPHQRRRRNR